MPKRSNPLNARQTAFVQEYLIDKNATQAAIRAGYAPGSAKIQGHRLLTNDNVDQVVTSELAKMSEDAGITAEAVIVTIKRLLKTAEDNGNVHAALKACDMLAKHLGMYIERVESNHAVELSWAAPPALPDPTVIDAVIVKGEDD